MLFGFQLIAQQATMDIEDKTDVTPASSVNVAVNADFSQSGGVSAFSLDIEYAPSVVTFTGITNEALSGISFSTPTSNLIRITWNDNSVQSTLNGKLLDLVFDYNGGDADITFNESNCEIGDNNAGTIPTSYTNGSISQIEAAPAFYMNDQTAGAGETVNFPVYANDFYNIGAFDIQIAFANTGVLSGGTVTVANVHSSLSGNLSSNFDDTDVMNVSWYNGSTENVSLADNTKLFDLQFTYAGGSSDVTFESGTKVYENVAGQPEFTNLTTSDGSISEGQTSVFEVKVFLEGFYMSDQGKMRKAQDYAGGQFGDYWPGSQADVITIELHETTNYGSPAHTFSDVALAQDGTAEINTDNISGSYYLTVKHRNHIETVSADPIDFSNTGSYDFSTSASQAFGNNQKELESGVYGIYAGDVNQDGSINIDDSGTAITDVRNGLQGYVPCDITGNGSVNIDDSGTVITNVRNGISKKTP